MKTKIFLLAAFLFLILNNNSVFAQGCEGDLPATSTDGTGVPKTSSLIFFGYIQPQFTANFYEDPTNTFEFKRARFGMRGRVNRSFSYYFSMEVSPFVSNTGNPYLLDAFVTFDKFKWAKASLGSYKQPFSLENIQPCYGLMTIDRSMVVNQIVTPQRDYGIMLLGGDNTTKFNYRVALMNGYGLGSVDNNIKKDLIGYVTYQAFDFLAIGASYRYGYPTNDNDDRQTYGLQFLANYEGFALQGEFIHDKGAYNLATGGGCGSEPVPLGPERQGAYLMLSYMSKFNLQPVFKWEYFDADTEIKYIGYEEMFTYGINYFFNDNTRLQINYQNKVEDGFSIKNNALLCQMQVKF